MKEELFKDIKDNIIINIRSYVFHNKTLYLTHVDANSFCKNQIKNKLINYNWKEKINEFSIDFFKKVNDRIDELIINKNK